MDAGMPARRPGELPAGSAADREADLTAAVRRMTHASPQLMAMAGGSGEVDRLLDGIENVWLDAGGVPIHLDLHRAEQPRAIVVFQPGSGSHARFYFLAAGLLARHGYHVLAVDRPGHGLSGGPRGDCTVDEAIEVVDTVITHGRAQWSLPVVLMGSSLGGLLTIFGLLRGSTPDLAVAHNFVQPGKLVSMRLRSRWIRRRRTRPYPLVELVHGFEDFSDDPAIRDYLERRDDPGAAWQLSARSVASLFGFTSKAPATAPPSLVLNGERDKAIPAWATRLFTRWSGLPSTEVVVVPDAGHLLFHDHLDTTLPIVTRWVDAHL
jgi:alpha-beta hydrolase superfamily lysophospholipase